MPGTSEQIDWFSQRDEDSYRDEAKNILDSYAHPWDVLAELAQNAVDALDQARETPLLTGADPAVSAQITIEIDRAQRSIAFRDNGIGIQSDDLKKVLRPHFSRKRGRTLRGEKGVGLTYVALFGNRFEIRTKSGGTLSRLTVSGARDWLRNAGEMPKIVVENLKEDPFPGLHSFSEVRVEQVPEPVVDSEELDIFSLTFDQMSYLLRTRTAIGWTGVLFGLRSPGETDVTLTMRAANGTEESKAIPSSFAPPSERMTANAVLSLDEVKKYLGERQEKKIYGKAIAFHEIFTSKNGKEVRAYCFLASRHIYNEQSDALALHEDLKIQGGIYIATKGMPTGILLPPPRTGRAGYWPNFFMVLEYDHLTLDLGRKSITAPRTIEMLSKQAAQVFNEVDRYIPLTIREDEGTLDALVSQDELQEELMQIKAEPVKAFRDNRQGNRLPEIYPFTREPRQEQDVVAIFSMSLARGLFPYELLRLSSTYRYDGFLRFVHEKKAIAVVAEFKLHGESILKDLHDAKARYGQLALLICWSMDEEKLRKAGFIIDEIAGEKKELPGATHKLSFPSSAGIKDTPIAVICLCDIFSVVE
jgi:hypothetical protein